MKLSLRNVAFGVALAASTLAFAQEPFTVTKNWGGMTTTETLGCAPNQTMRTATGYNGKLYAVDRTGETGYKLVEISADGVKVLREDLPLHCGGAITSDDAGNLIISQGQGFWAEGTANHMIMLKASEGYLGEPVALNPTFPDEATFLAANRSDNYGIVAGDVFSENGGVFFVTNNTLGLVGGVYVQNGAAVEGAFEFLSDAVPDAASSETYAVPAFNTVDEIFEQEAPYNAFYYHHRGQLIYAWDGTAWGQLPVTFPEGWQKNSSPGFGVFTLGGVKYQVLAAAMADVHSANFLIADMEGNVVWKSDIAQEDDNIGFGNNAGMVVRQVSDTKVEIYRYKPNASGAYIAQYTVEAAGTPAPAGVAVKPLFSRMITETEVAGLGGDVRSAVGYKDALYALNKAKGTIYKITGTEVTEYRTGLKTETLGPGITTDDAGNLLVCYGWPDAFTGMAIVPADGSDIKYIEGEALTFPEGWNPVRVDAMGRIVGDMLSEEGAYFYLGGKAAGQAAACYYISGGVFTPEEYTSSNYTVALQNMDVVVPMFNTFAEQSEVDPLYDGGCLIPWNGYGPEIITDGAGVRVGRPEAEGVAYSAVIGGDVISHDGKRYYIIPYTRSAGKRTGDFLIYDEDLNIVFKTETEGGLDITAGAFINGGNITAIKTGDNTYAVGFWGGTKAGTCAAIYEVTLPGAVVPAEPGKMYVVGQPTNWVAPTEENAAAYANYVLNETEAGSKVYTGTISVPFSLATFRFFTTLGGWDAEQYGIAAEDAAVNIEFKDNVYEGALVAGKGSVNVPKWLGGTMTITLDLNANTVKIVPAEKLEAPVLYVRGAFNEWGTTVKMNAPQKVDADGLLLYTATVEDLAAGEFKIATEDWNISYGKGADEITFANGAAADVFFNGANLVSPGVKNAAITLKVSADRSAASKLTLAWGEAADGKRNNYAYAITVGEEANGKYPVTFKSTGDATATLIAKSAEGDKTFEIGAVTKGENTYQLDAAELAKDVEYTIAISISNDNGATAPALVYVGPKFVNKTRGGMAVVTDPESDAYGYAVACAGKAQGVQVYTPDLEYVGQFHNGYAGWVAGNQSSPFRGAAREGLAVFGDYSDGGANYYTIDPLNPSEMNTMLGAPATMSADGMWSLDGAPIGGGNAGVAFRGKGENTQMFTMIEDFTDHGNTLARYDLGTATMITKAPAMWYTNANAQLPNHNLQIVPVETGLFVTQIRANETETSVPRLIFVDYEDNVKALWWNDTFDKSCGAAAITADGTILAVGTQSSILFFDVEYSEDNVPTLTKIDGWDIALNSSFADYQFDAAGNLYVYNRDSQGVSVYALPLNAAVETPAKTTVKGIGSGVEDVAVDAVDGEAVYYNLNGVRVAAEELTPGVYVKVVGNKATKVVVK